MATTTETRLREIRSQVLEAMKSLPIRELDRLVYTAQYEGGLSGDEDGMPTFAVEELADFVKAVYEMMTVDEWEALER